MMFKKAIFLLVLSFSISSFAQTRLPSFFSDNMVLQQNEKVNLWGNDKPGTDVTISASWGNEASVRSDDSGKWKVSIQTPQAGGPYTISIKGSEELTLKNVLIGEVWLCSGQSNMYMPMRGYSNSPINGSMESVLNSRNDQIRLFHTPESASLEPMDDLKGQWFLSEPATVNNFSAVAYFFAKKMQGMLNVPIGIIHTSFGGSWVEAWMDENTLSNFDNIVFPKEVDEDRRVHREKPTLLYNAMLHPFVGYTIKGVLWYQGESNRHNANEYYGRFPALIDSWRQLWQQGSFPFYYVQIAPYGYTEGEIVKIREAQLQTMQEVDNTGMVVTMDIGECDNIHPSEKKIVADRLAYWALAKDYGYEGMAFCGPVYRETEMLEGGKLKLSFEFAPTGFSSFGKELSGFEIAGKDKVFHPAEVAINADRTITVWSGEVADPVAVRYAYGDCIEGTLFNTWGLPASPFRTDDWDL